MYIYILQGLERFGIRIIQYHHCVKEREGGREREREREQARDRERERENK